MTKKTLSPYMNKTLRRNKIQNVKCRLTAYILRSEKGSFDPNKVFFYEVKASDGSYKKLTNEQDAIAAYENLIEFQKRQMVFSYG